MKGQACRCGGEGTTIVCVLAVSMTCVTWVVVEVVTQELVAVMRHSVEVCINRCNMHSGVRLPAEGGCMPR